MYLKKNAQRMDWAAWLVFTLIFLGLPSMVHADLMDVLTKFQPSLTLEEQYSDNINLTHKNKKDDFITTIYPGLKFSTLPKSAITGQFQEGPPTEEEKLGIDLNYRLGLVFYAKETENNYISHEGTLNAWYSPDRRLTFRVREYLIRSEEPRERDYSAQASSGQYLLATQRERSIYLRNVLEPSVEYKFGPENLFALSYRNNIYDNQNPQFQDSREDFLNPRLTYWFDIRNGVSLEYGLTVGDFERSPDLVGHMFRGRYTYRFTPRTSIFAEYTLLRRDFKDPGIDYDVHQPSLGIEHAFSPTLSGRVQLGYFWQNPPARSSGTDGLFYDAALTQRAEKTTYTLSFQGGYTEDYFTAQNLGFVKYHRAIGTITHRFWERMTLGFLGTLERAQYTSGRTDWTWGIGGNGFYQILRWLNLSLDISYRDNNSNVLEAEYSEVRGIFRISVIYP